MNKWNKISLYKFQQIEKINETNTDDLDKLLFTTCVVFDMTDFELDNTPKAKAEKLIGKVHNIFAANLETVPQKRIGQYFLNYDMDKMSWGQWNELSFWLPKSIENAHKILATISGTDGHKERSEYFLYQPIPKIIGCIQLISERFKNFMYEYKNLFGLDKEQHDGEVVKSQFILVHGWQYSTEQIANYQRVSLDQAYGLPARQCLNALVYLKAKAKFEYEQSKKK